MCVTRLVRWDIRLSLVVALLAGVCAVFPAVVRADSYEVTELAPDDVSVAGTLRWAVAQANANVGLDTITFHPDLAGTTIILTEGQIDITDDLEIAGLGMDQLTISGNNASRIFRAIDISLTLRDLTLIDGRFVVSVNIDRGGALKVEEGSATVERVAFINNRVEETPGGETQVPYGGAISIEFGTSLVVRDSVFTGNYAKSQGGAIHSIALHLEVTGSTFEQNISDAGGAIFAFSPASGSFVANTTFSENEAKNGAVFVQDGILEMMHVTLAHNTTDLSGRHVAVTAGATLRLWGTLLTGGSGPDACRVEGATIESLGYNLGDEDATETCNLDHDTDIMDANADLLDLADNGGPTPTHALGPDSEALDAVPAEACAPEIATDQRGVERPQAAGCDIGAFELEAAPAYYSACLHAGSLSQMAFVGEAPTLPDGCGRGEPVLLLAAAGAEALHGCLYAGSLTQVGTEPPISCGRGTAVALQVGDALRGCLYAGRLTQLGFVEPASCGRGEQVGLALPTT